MKRRRAAMKEYLSAASRMAREMKKSCHSTCTLAHARSPVRPTASTLSGSGSRSNSCHRIPAEAARRRGGGSCPAPPPTPPGAAEEPVDSPGPMAGSSPLGWEGRIQGSSDYSVLTSKGEVQAETSRQMLLSDSFDVCFTSPLIRSKRTAEIIWGSREAEMIPEPDLREIDLYSFQGLLKHEGKAKYGDAYREWQMNAANFNIDGHYPVRELWARARSCWGKILAHDGKSVLVVAHNAVNQALVATALGLNTKYFRVLLQSNCGVSVLDFTPNQRGGSPHICLNRLNQTPNSPIARGSSGGRKTCKRIILVCHGATQSNAEAAFGNFGYEPMNMLGVIQAQKTAEVLLDVKVNSIICSPRIASVDTATAITEVQEAADCLGADCVPRYVEMKRMLELEVEGVIQQGTRNQGGNINGRPGGWLAGIDDKVITAVWNQSGEAWRCLLKELLAGDQSEPERNVVAVGHPAAHIALIGHCLNLAKEKVDSFHLDYGSISVIDFPDGPEGRGGVRCVNYTAHLGRWSIPVTRSTEKTLLREVIVPVIPVRRSLRPSPRIERLQGRLRTKTSHLDGDLRNRNELYFRNKGVRTRERERDHKLSNPQKLY